MQLNTTKNSHRYYYFIIHHIIFIHNLPRLLDDEFFMNFHAKMTFEGNSVTSKENTPAVIAITIN